MGKSKKIGVFIIIAFTLSISAALLKEAGAGSVMWIAGTAIFIVYHLMFKGSSSKNRQKKDAKLKISGSTHVINNSQSNNLQEDINVKPDIPNGPQYIKESIQEIRADKENILQTIENIKIEIRGINQKKELLQTGFDAKVLSKEEYLNKIDIIETQEGFKIDEIRKLEDLLKGIKDTVQRKSDILVELQPKHDKLEELFNTGLISEKDYIEKVSNLYLIEKEYVYKTDNAYNYFSILEMLEKHKLGKIFHTKNDEANFIIKMQDYEEELIQENKLCKHCSAIDSIVYNYCRACGKAI